MTLSRTIRRALVAMAAGLAVAAAPAAAMPAATITVEQAAPRTFVFTSTPCMFGFCGYTWTGRGETSNRLGFQMGRTNPLTFTFSAAGVYTVTVTVGGKCSPTSTSNCPAYGWTQVVAQ